MIIDLVHNTYNAHLITRNVMSVFSTNRDYTDNFIRTLKYSNYIIDNNVAPVHPDSIISKVDKNINLYKNVFRFVKDHKHIDYNKVSTFLSYINLSHVLWLQFIQLNSDELTALITIMQLASDKPVIITDYLDGNKYYNLLLSLIYSTGIEDKLIIIPFTNVFEAVKVSTCQCYVKSYTGNKILSRFPNEFLNHEFNTHTKYIYNHLPILYRKPSIVLSPLSYKYTLLDLLMMAIFFIKTQIALLTNWRLSCH